MDGIYTADPVKDPSAEMLEEITFQDAISRNLRVMDTSALSLCRDNNLPILVFNLFKKGNLLSIIMGEKLGTRVG